MIRSFGGKTPRVHAEAFISEMAYVVGDVEIGPGTGVWPGAVIRGDFAAIRIGAHCQIEDNAVLHTGTPMQVGDHVIMGHGVVMHGRRVGSHVLIGNNATVLDDAEIEDGCVVGANALVSARLHVPSGSFVVGVPAEVRPLPEHLRAMVAGGGNGRGGYAEMVRLYVEEGLGSPPA